MLLRGQGLKDGLCGFGNERGVFLLSSRLRIAAFDNILSSQDLLSSYWFLS